MARAGLYYDRNRFHFDLAEAGIDFKF